MLRELFRNAVAVLCSKWRLWLALTIIAAAGALALLRNDSSSAQYWASHRTETNQRIANAVSCWGDFPRGWLMLLALIGGAGWFARKPNWRIAALAALLAGSAAGLQVHAIRFTVGRARPSTEAAAGFYGPTLDRAYHSFPSAHTTCAFAVATALLLMMPLLGGPAVMAAMLVGWSRLALTAHYPTDVWVGMWLGILNGVIFGLAARQLPFTGDKTPAP